MCGTLLTLPINLFVALSAARARVILLKFRQGGQTGVLYSLSLFWSHFCDPTHIRAHLLSGVFYRFFCGREGLLSARALTRAFLFSLFRCHAAAGFSLSLFPFNPGLIRIYYFLLLQLLIFSRVCARGPARFMFNLGPDANLRADARMYVGFLFNFSRTRVNAVELAAPRKGEKSSFSPLPLFLFVFVFLGSCRARFNGLLRSRVFVILLEIVCLKCGCLSLRFAFELFLLNYKS